ncbi:MAG: type VI secretion system tip protein VgrG [Sphingobacteriales bacterium]|nr:MAG: type VI secretion system tip protein VgrG [Sphingobacteriales bacterium]
MPDNKGAQSFTITINGQAMPDSVGLLEIVVTNLVNSIPKAKIIVKDGSASAQDFELSNKADFIPGSEITVAAGNGGENETIFSGIIVSQTIKADREGSILEIECRDKAVQLTAGRKNKVFEEMSDGDVVEQIISDAGLTADVTDLKTQHKQLVQYNVSDWDFIVTRTELNSALVIAENGMLKIAPPDFNQASAATYTYGAEIYEFEAQMDARTQYPKVLTKSWSYANQEIQEGESTETTLPEQGNVSGSDLANVLGWENSSFYHTGNVANEESASWATAALFRSRLNKISGSFRVIGDHKLKPGIIVELLGIGERFSGKCLVTGVTQSYSNQAAWYSHVQFGLDKTLHNFKYDDVTEKQASGIIPAVNGLQIGIVTEIHDDPAGENRIRVKMPMVDNQGDGIWARLASLDAGNGRGWVWNPELNDEVIVGFLNDDPRDAVILGSLYSSAKAPHITADEENKQKGILTREKLQILFDDDKKIIKISTDAGNTITLDENDKAIKIVDQNGNKLEMTSEGITIESVKDIILKASGDVKIKATNISESASAELKLEGSGGAELSSSAIAKIKGSIVQIN